MAAIEVGQVNRDLAVETTRAQERIIEDVGAIGRGDDDDTFVAIKAIHLDEEGVERLLAFVVTPADTGTTLTTDSVNLIDEDDTGRVLAALLKHVTDASRTDTDEHFNEVGTTDRKERHLGLASDCFG